VPKFKRQWIPAIIVCIVIFILSSIPGETIDNSGFGNATYQINAHFFLYFLLGIVLFKATKRLPKVFLVGFLYSISDEIHQMFVPNRTFQIFDIVTDTAGILLAGVILWKLYYLLPKKLKTWLEK
jgi:VanZ family protein